MGKLADKIIADHPELDDPNVDDDVLDARYNRLVVEAIKAHDPELMDWFIQQLSDELTSGPVDHNG
jgi:hypothetical protein